MLVRVRHISPCGGPRRAVRPICRAAAAWLVQGALVLAPARFASADPGPAEPEPSPENAAEESPDSPMATPADEPEPAKPDAEPDARPDAESEPAGAAPEEPSPGAETPDDVPSGSSGVTGSPSRASAEDAARAQGELEGDVLATPAESVPERMRPLETAAWWTMFGALALATTAGVFSGLAEKQEDEAIRLASEFDEDGRQLLYEDHQSEYEDILEKGDRYQWTARGFLIASGAAVAAGITLFAVFAKRSKEERRRARITPLGAEVKF
jgi:hypothetical protein